MENELKKTKGSAEVENEKIRKGDTLDYYNEDLPLKAVGKLFEEKAISARETKKGSEPSMEYEFLNRDKDRDLKKVHERYSTKTTAAPLDSNIKKSTSVKKTDVMYDYDDEDDYDDEPESPPIKIIIPIVGCIFLVILLFLIYKVNSATNQLKQAEESAGDYVQLNQEYQSLKIENEALQSQVDSLQAQLASNIGQQPNATDDNTSSTTNPASENDQGSSGDATQNSEYTLYTVVQGDSLSKISQKFYGTQGQYQRIKDYNGMTSDNVAIGQSLKIPK